MRRRVLAIAAACALAGSLLTGCSSSTAGQPAPSTPTTVFAAASLSAPFKKIAADDQVTFSFEGSSTLVDQIAAGARADVLATADTATMDKAVEKGLVGTPTRFATNVLVLITPADNPAKVTGFDESLQGTRLVICAPQVPCGRATAALAQRLQVTLTPVSEESKVTDVLGKVVSGEADAGLVYATDAAGASKPVNVIRIPEAAETPNEYWIAPVTGGDATKAQAFIGTVTSPDGAKVLAEAGFGAA